MKSRTSFFNFTVLKKDLLRTSVLWILLLLTALLELLPVAITSLFLLRDELAVSLVYAIRRHGLYQLFFGWLYAILLFGDLFKPRAANFLHALPLRREGWFFTHTVSALLIFLLGQVIPGLLDILLMPDFWYLPLLSIAVEFGAFLFFFSVAVFCVQCAGTKLGATAMYLVVNFATQLLLFFGKTFFQPHLYGILIESRLVNLLCPSVEILFREFVALDVDYSRQTTAIYQGLIAGDWWYLLALVAVGVVFYFLALHLYRRRHIEKAGNFLVQPAAALTFVLLSTFFSGAVWFQIGLESYILLLIGLGVGFFVGLILLEKQLKVFRKGTLLTFAALALALFGTIGILRADPLGVVNYVPAAAEVESATLQFDSEKVPLTWENGVKLDTEEELQQLQQLHQGLLDHRSDKESSIYTLFISYQLKDGRSITRGYPYPTRGQLQRQANTLLSRLDLFESTDILRNVVSIHYDHGNDTQAYPDAEIRAEGLISGAFDPRSDVKILSTTTLDENPEAIAMWEALRKDSLNGGMSQFPGYQTSVSGTLWITFRNEDGSTESAMIIVFTGCDNFRHLLLTLKDAQ